MNRKTPINTNQPILLLVKINGTGRYLSIPSNMKMKSIIKIIDPKIISTLKRNALKKWPNESSCKPL